MAQYEDLKIGLEKATAEYRAAVKWARFVIDYKRAYEGEEDFREDSLKDYLTMIKVDSRDEIKSVAVDIKRLKEKIKSHESRLMDLAKRNKK